MVFKVVLQVFKVLLKGFLLVVSYRVFIVVFWWVFIAFIGRSEGFRTTTKNVYLANPPSGLYECRGPKLSLKNRKNAQHPRKT